MTTNKKLPEDTIIRRATVEDAAEIANVHIHSWRETYKGLLPEGALDQIPLTFRDRMNLWKKVAADTRKALYVAETKESIVGFSGFSAAREPAFKDHGELGVIYLLEKYHGLGIGFALLKIGMKQLLEWNYSKAYCWVMKGSRTTQFYEKSGAVFSGMEQEDEIFGVKTRDVAYVWSHLEIFRE